MTTWTESQNIKAYNVTIDTTCATHRGFDPACQYTGSLAIIDPSMTAEEARSLAERRMALRVPANLHALVVWSDDGLRWMYKPQAEPVARN